MIHPMRADGQHLSIAEIRAWRIERHAEGEPSGLLDYFRAHDLCPTCKGLGTAATYFANRPIGEKTCPLCNGTCRWSTK